MNKVILFATMLITLVFANAKAQTTATDEATASNKVEISPISSLRLDVNAMTPEQASKINEFISARQTNRGFWLTMGTALLTTLASHTSSITINEIMKVADIRQNKKNAWEELIWNECHYVDSLTYINTLTDFYSEGSYNSALDPADLRFNGFTLNAQRNGEDVLKFYCHVDTSDEGLCEIYNHSKFRLVLDSMYFYPYRCHLPNWSANHIYLDEDEEYDRNTRFSFEERDNLKISLDFAISSSWYNEAIILAKNVKLGEFHVQVPIEKSSLTDSVFVYKKGMEGQKPLNITGDCFIVPRSFMPLPGGVSHWGTGEYNVKVTVSERCGITSEMEENWKEDYRCLKRMRKENKAKEYFISIYEQNGSSVVRSLLETASRTALNEAGL